MKRGPLHFVFILLLMFSGGNIVLAETTSTLSIAYDTNAQNPIRITQSSVNDFYIVNVGVVTDYEFYLINGSSTEIYINQIMEYAFELYYNSSIPVYFVLDTVMIMTSQSLSNSTFFIAETKEREIDANELLSKFTTFSENELSLRNLDLTVLLTGRDFIGSTVGLAYREIDPGVFSQSIIQGGREFTKMGETVAHEMGHNFGAVHDGADNICSGVGFVMAPAINIPRAEKFSSCSIDEINNHLNTSWLLEIDSDPPSLTRYNYTTLELGLLSTFWSISSRYADYYNVFVNNSLIETATWSLSQDIISSVINSVGIYNVSLEVYDLMGRNSTDSFLIQIVDTTDPLIFIGHRNSAADQHIEIIVGYSDNFLTMNITDHSPGNLRISLDSTVVFEKLWDHHLWFEYDLKDLGEGDHLLVVNATDTSGNNVMKELKISVLPDPQIISSTSIASTISQTTSTPRITNSESTNPLVVGGSTILGLISTFIIIPIWRRKLQ